jgi:hypothetical protein
MRLELAIAIDKVIEQASSKELADYLYMNHSGYALDLEEDIQAINYLESIEHEGQLEFDFSKPSIGV